ncbi:hypothetical protein TNIN_121681 [Trichonephila inaurata madagascariensis]|uniref:Uncharacterized protein n=1 Tax=Trichonephila inaurata madagascariensis TaxID=2747483 RepID=A0A8X6YLY9_9ARAC|nr:hypothetical protein TNIN_121681 [Trichonephila inaurata madagascariensis]
MSSSSKLWRNPITANLGRGVVLLHNPPCGENLREVHFGTLQRCLISLFYRQRKMFRFSEDATSELEMNPFPDVGFPLPPEISGDDAMIRTDFGTSSRRQWI